MNPPKMPVHIGDYMRDTGHLRAAEHGAYLMLLFHHWSTGSLPTDDRQLSAIARMSSAEWRRAKPVIQPFFGEGWRHGRVEEDLAKARASYEARAKAGEKGGKAKAAGKQSSSNATAPPQQPYTLNLEPGKKDSEPKGSAMPEEAEVELFRRGKSILGASAGGLVAKLKAHHGGSIAKTRATIELASTKENPREWVNRVINGRRDDGFAAPAGAIV